MNAIELETYLWLGQSWTSNSQQWLFFTTDFGKLIHHLSNLNLPVAPPHPSHARLNDNNNRPTSRLHLHIQIDLVFIFTLDVVNEDISLFFFCYNVFIWGNTTVPS